MYKSSFCITGKHSGCLEPACVCWCAHSRRTNIQLGIVNLHEQVLSLLTLGEEEQAGRCAAVSVSLCKLLYPSLLGQPPMTETEIVQAELTDSTDSDRSVCPTCGGSGHVCFKCGLSRDLCECLETPPGAQVGTGEVVQDFDPVRCDRCGGSGREI